MFLGSLSGPTGPALTLGPLACERPSKHIPPMSPPVDWVVYYGGMDKIPGKWKLVLKEPRNLQEEEWESILEQFTSHPYQKVLQRLKNVHNAPQRAGDLFEGFDVSVWNQAGPETINAIFRKRQLPYRLTRIGTWAGEGSRANRMLALVPWPLE